LARHDIVVIGGSAGAIEALAELLAVLPEKLPAALFIVVHRATVAGDALPRILDAAGPLRVVDARDGEKIEHGRVYLAPPDAHLLIEAEFIRLGSGPHENMSRPAIDPLFRSAALNHGSRVVGIVLSGLMDDGVSGLAAIERRGGIVVVQDPVEALEPALPRAALAAVEADHVVPAAEIGRLLDRLVRLPADRSFATDRDLRLEVQIAAGQPPAPIGPPSPFSCPECGGVLNEASPPPLRFRCQVGHAYTGRELESLQQQKLEEALYVAFRVLTERLKMIERLETEARDRERPNVANMYETRAAELTRQIEALRAVLFDTLRERQEALERQELAEAELIRRANDP
jgi:two-component system chemotaxis response regulator CheB